ncbi:MAG: hypothetical protein KC524_02775 [Gammaproteobacteria bacterium]|jgi:hypothetical protein|nr:hypothetical protein [Gammaproteobacteria bacterium]MDB2328549.1 hypothetical protein [Pseudomonadales bacterium]
MASIRQIQAKYDAEEDRLLLRVGTDEAQAHGILLTRRYLQLLLKALGQYAAADPDVGTLASASDRQDVQDYKERQALDRANFETPFAAASDPEVSAPQAYQLAYKLTYRIKEDQLHVSLLPKAGEGLNLTFNHEIAVSITAILHSAASKADWRIQAPVDPLVQQNLKIVN